MIRGKSAGQGNVCKSATEDIRVVFKHVSPYISHRWRDICEELGVTDDVLNEIEAGHENTRMSEIAFRGLCKWQEIAGRSVSKEKLLKVIQQLGLKRAEDELRFLSPKRIVPYMGRPATAPGTQEQSVNKQAKQKALTDRLARPKTSSSSDQDSSKQKKKEPTIRSGVNPLAAQVFVSKPTDICQVKLKVTVKGVQRLDKDEMEQTRDDFRSTKDDFKSTCFNFVKLVIANRKEHFRELKDLIGFNGISVQSLSQIGFNVNVYLLCSSLGAFEILYHNYRTGRLRKIVHSALVSRDHLNKLKVRRLDLSVEMDEGLINKYRDILIVRGPEEEAILHPVDVVEYFQCHGDEEHSLDTDIDKAEIERFNLKSWQEETKEKILQIDKKCQEFEGSLKELFRVLRIARDVDKPEVTCLQEVINCYHHLKYSKSVAAQCSRSDLVYDYIAIVNLIRVTVQEISDKTILIAFEENLNPNSCDEFHRILARIECMLHPGYCFEEDDTISDGHVTTGLEKEMFGKFLCYLPKLQRLLHSLCCSLKMSSDDTNSAGDSSNEKPVLENKDSMEADDKHCHLVKEENNNVMKVPDLNTNTQDVLEEEIQRCTIDSIAHPTPGDSKSPSVNYIHTWTQN